MGRMSYFAVSAVLGSVGQALICVVFTPIFGLPAVALSSLAYQGTLVIVTFVVMRKRLGRIGLRGIVKGQLQALIGGIADDRAHGSDCGIEPVQQRGGHKRSGCPLPRDGRHRRSNEAHEVGGRDHELDAAPPARNENLVPQLAGLVDDRGEPLLHTHRRTSAAHIAGHRYEVAHVHHDERLLADIS